MQIEIGGWAWLDKTHMTPDQVRWVRGRLTVRPRQTYHGANAKAPQPIKLYAEVDDRLGVPRQWFADNQKRSDNDISHSLSDGFSIDLESKIVQDGPYAEQAVARQAIVDAVTGGDALGGILQAGCGFGKTVVALDILNHLGRTAIIVVHKEFLVDQWRQRIEQFLPNAKIGIIKQSQCDYEGKDICIALIQSLSKREYPSGFYSYFGTLISDELHRVGAATWANVIPMFNSRYRVGLTATPRRKDGAENVFYWHVGRVLYKAKTEALPVVARVVHTSFTASDGQPPAIFLNLMARDTFRNKLVADQLVEAVDAGRKILVMGERLEGLEAVKSKFEQLRPQVQTGVYCGEWFVSIDDKNQWETVNGRRKKVKRKKRKVKREEMKESESAQVIFATKQMVEEGLDIWDLDTLFLVSPISDVEQAVGRIRRRPPPGAGGSKSDPMVVDFVDDRTAIGRKRFKSRSSFYRGIGAMPDQARAQNMIRRNA